MAETLSKNRLSALRVLPRVASAHGAKPDHFSVWNYAGFLIATGIVTSRDPMPDTVLGFKIKTDPTIAHGRVELRDANEQVLGVIENIGGVDG
jgi:hypothetical protein